MTLKEKGYDVDAIHPQAAIYLSAKINILGKTTEQGAILATDDDVQRYLLDVGKIGILPFFLVLAPISTAIGIGFQWEPVNLRTLRQSCKALNPLSRNSASRHVIHCPKKYDDDESKQ